MKWKFLKDIKKKKFTSVKIKGDTVWLTVLSLEKSFQKSGAREGKRRSTSFFPLWHQIKVISVLKKSKWKYVEFVLSHQCLLVNAEYCEHFSLEYKSKNVLCGIHLGIWKYSVR